MVFNAFAKTAARTRPTTTTTRRRTTGMSPRQHQGLKFPLGQASPRNSLARTSPRQHQGLKSLLGPAFPRNSLANTKALNLLLAQPLPETASRTLRFEISSWPGLFPKQPREHQGLKSPPGPASSRNSLASTKA